MAYYTMAKVPPHAQIKYRLAHDDYKKISILMPNKLQVVATMSSIGDINSTSMIAGTEFVKNLGLTKNDLLPMNMLIWNTNKIAMDIISMVIMEIKVEGQNTVVKQIVYIASNTNEVFLSREACEQLGLILEDPQGIGQELNHIGTNPIPKKMETKELPCTHPKRIAPLPLPTEM